MQELEGYAWQPKHDDHTDSNLVHDIHKLIQGSSDSYKSEPVLPWVSNRISHKLIEHTDTND